VERCRPRTRHQMSRRAFLVVAAAAGISAAWARSRPGKSKAHWRSEQRDLYPEGVASGDPDSTSVILWTRRPFSGRSRARLWVEVAEDRNFESVVATSPVEVLAAADWTCRVMVGNLKPARIYWYRFVDESGAGSRTGRTITAPGETDERPIRFAFLCCQNENMGAQHAYRRMLFEDQNAAESDRLQFVLHLGDFIYEVIWYPEDRPKGVSGRTLREVVRYPHGEKIADFHIPVTVEDYRAVYRAYLHDADLQDARAWLPFVCIWDNHEFSWSGWQSLQRFEGKNRPAQTRKVAANQAWFEYQPARVVTSRRGSWEQFHPPAVLDAQIGKFDSHGFGDEPNNRLAVSSLKGYRALRWGRHIDLLITDQRSYRSEPMLDRPEADALGNESFPELVPREAVEMLDAGQLSKADAVTIGGKEIANFRKTEPPQTILGEEQKRWFLERLSQSQATWKIWGNTLGTLDYRADPQNLPAGLTDRWPGKDYATFRSQDWSTAYHERAEIYNWVRDKKVTGFTTVAGDRHSFWAGLAAAALPPEQFEPVGIAFVTGAISSPSPGESLERGIHPEHPLSALYVLKRDEKSKPELTVNMLIRHGVRACLEYAESGDAERARRLSNPNLSPHLSFLDFGGHGYATVRASGGQLECEFVCITRPVESIIAPDGGPLVYRVVHRAKLWKSGEAPRLEQQILEGNPQLSI
jgi:alkaline phosphatase D